MTMTRLRYRKYFLGIKEKTKPVFCEWQTKLTSFIVIRTAARSALGSKARGGAEVRSPPCSSGSLRRGQTVQTRLGFGPR